MPLGAEDGLPQPLCQALARALQISSAPWISSEGTSATQVFERRPLTEPNGHDVDAEPGFDRPSLFVVLIIPDVQ
ncbi:hypothetical protein LTR94_006374 [Friedmanniomyces endolithicus]|nr:hypothetical protein LTR94_006374 [Friedmanniomyces endolithicus]